MRLPSRPAVFLLLFAIVTACVPGPKAPDVSATRTLELSDDTHTKASSRPFGVVAGSPTGETREQLEVSVVLNRPLRPLEAADDRATETPVPARITTRAGAAPKGKWQWMGTQAFVFVPESYLPAATEYVVTVPAGTRALDGSTLAADYTFSFSTPRPEVGLASGVQTSGLGPASTLRLAPNVPLDPKEIERTTFFVPKSKRGKIAVRAAFAAKPNEAQIEIRAVRPLPLATDFELHVAAGLRAKEGPLPSTKEASFAVSTYGPLKVSGIECDRQDDGRCDPGGGVRVSVTNPVRSKDLRAAVSVSGRPVPKDAYESSDGAEDTQTLWVPGPLPPGGTVTVAVRPGLHDSFGQTLVAGSSTSFRIADLPGRLVLGVEGEVFERKQPPSARTLSLRSVNVDTYELATAKLDEEQVARWAGIDARDGNDASHGYLASLPSKKRTVKPGVAKNHAAGESVSLDAALGAPAGVVAVLTSAELRNRGVAYPHKTSNVLRVTDLAISAKVSRFGGVLWVTRLSDAQPVAGAAVRLRSSANGAVVFQGQSDAAGLVEVPAGVAFQGAEAPLVVAVASLGDDWTYRSLGNASNLGYWPDPARELSTVAMLFTDRGLYRRGESVHVKALVRQEAVSGLSTPAGQRIAVWADDANGTKIFEKEAVLGAFGEAAFEIPVGDGAPLGDVSISAHVVGREDAGSARETVQIAAYKPAEFQTTAAFGKPAHVRGDKASCSAHGEYLFGAPLSQGSARFTLSRRATWFTPPGHEGRIVDDGTWAEGSHAASPAYRLISSGKQDTAKDSGDGPLDAHGNAHHDVTLVMPEQRGPESVTCEADVTDVSRASFAGETTTLVHPGTFYVALDAPEGRFAAERSVLAPKVRAVDPLGKVRAGVPVHLELIKRSWASVYEEQGEDGGHYVTEVKDQLLKTCDTRTVAGVGAATCNLQLEGAGYYVVHATAIDERKNPLGASYGLYVTGESGASGWALRDDASLELVTDKPSYEVGQTAKVLVKSPFVEADALVTVERATTMQKLRVHVKGPAPVIPVPIGPEVRPNAYVTVELIRGRIAEGTAAPVAAVKPGVIQKRRKESPKTVDLGGPSYRIGTTQLQVNPASRRLKVAVKTAKTQYAPGEQLEADVDVRDAAGKGAETDVTFYVVDEGVLMLSGYKTPDPVPTFTAGLPLRVASFETRAELARLLKFRAALGTDKGLEGGGGGEGVRADFRTTAVFTSLKTDAQGHAHARAKLPEGLTTYRVMAVVAGRDDRFGFGENRVVTSRPLMVRPALPRFLRAGDQLDAGAILTGKGLPAGPVHVTIAATGVTVEGGADQTVQLPKDGSVEVRFKLRADRVGDATFTFRAEGLGAKDAAVFKKKVQIPTIMETVALGGETEKAVAEQLGNLDAVRRDAGDLTVRLASTALVGVEDVVDQLTTYPHGCTEQLSSRLLPLVESKELAQFFGISLANKPEKLADAAVTQIVERQHADGGFGYWPESPQSDPWLSTYVTLVLGRARDAGRPLPPMVLDRALAYVRGQIAGPVTSTSYLQRTFAVDVLASLGQGVQTGLRKKGAPAPVDPNAGLAGAIHALLPPPPDTPLFARALLTHAVAAAKLRPEDQQALAHDLEKYVHLTPTGAVVAEQAHTDRLLRQRLLDSDLRTTAMVLRALVAVDPAHPLAPKLARGLLASRKNGSYASTQEAAWVLVALDDYRKAYESAAPAFDARLFLGGTMAHEAGFRGGTARAQSVEYPLAKLFGDDGTARVEPLAFQVVGQGTLFYEARLRYARKANPTAPLARGFTVQKWLRGVTPETLQQATVTFPTKSDAVVAAGALVLVDVLVVNDLPQLQVVLDDPLPAGLEAVNDDLVGASRSLTSAVAAAPDDDDDDDEGGEYGYRGAAFVRRIDDDRVLTYVEDLPAGLHHYRYLARATTRGQFVLPPARAECMYEPEVFGRTAGATLTVR